MSQPTLQRDQTLTNRRRGDLATNRIPWKIRRQTKGCRTITDPVSRLCEPWWWRRRLSKRGGIESFDGWNPLRSLLTQPCQAATSHRMTDGNAWNPNVFPWQRNAEIAITPFPLPPIRTPFDWSVAYRWRVASSKRDRCFPSCRTLSSARARSDMHERRGSDLIFPRPLQFFGMRKTAAFAPTLFGRTTAASAFLTGKAFGTWILWTRRRINGKRDLNKRKDKQHSPQTETGRGKPFRFHATRIKHPSARPMPTSSAPRPR